MTSWAELKQGAAEEARQTEKFEDTVKFLMERGVKSVLDVGCGTGKFLALLREQDPTMYLRGIEQNPEASRIALKAADEVFRYPIDRYTSAQIRKFDAVTLWGVLEHLKSPIEHLSALSEHINPGGFLVLCVPNVESRVVTRLWEKCFTFCPQHLWYFSQADLTKIVEKCGLKKVEATTIEPEYRPVMRAEGGWPPYGPIPLWAWAIMPIMELLGPMDGYKIVYIAQKPPLQGVNAA